MIKEMQRNEGSERNICGPSKPLYRPYKDSGKAMAVSWYTDLAVDSSKERTKALTKLTIGRPARKFFCALAAQKRCVRDVRDLLQRIQEFSRITRPEFLF